MEFLEGSHALRELRVLASEPSLPAAVVIVDVLLQGIEDPADVLAIQMWFANASTT